VGEDRTAGPVMGEILQRQGSPADVLSGGLSGMLASF